MNLPNKLSFLRVLIIPFMIIYFYMIPNIISYDPGWIMLPILFIIASLTDFLDGYIARKYNLVTTFGKFIDPLADKLLVMAALLILNEVDIIPMWITVVILSREFIVTGIRLIAVQNGKVIAAGKLGKYKTASTMVALVILLFVPFYPDWLDAGLYILYIGVVLTVISGIEYFYKNKEIIMESI